MTDMDKLYPELTEDGAQKAADAMERFRQMIANVARDCIDEAVSNIYCDVIPNIESDSWTNFRNALMDGLCDYGNRRDHKDYDFKRIRQAILAEHREEIIADLNQDLLDEVESLKSTIDMIQRNRY